MTEAEWLACEEPSTMLHEVLSDASGSRKLRLFGCAACRRVWAVMGDDCRAAVEASECYADGLISYESLDLISAAAEEAWEDILTEPDGEGSTAASVAHAASYASSPSLALYVLTEATESVVEARGGDLSEERAAQSALLRDIFGNPFRPVSFDPAWRTDTAVSLARGMYDSRDFGAMPILADALQDAGCEEEAILMHCRDVNQPHVRGCWVCDLVLGKA
jgi:hypothetical protein